MQRNDPVGVNGIVKRKRYSFFAMIVIIVLQRWRIALNV